MTTVEVYDPISATCVNALRWAGQQRPPSLSFPSPLVGGRPRPMPRPSRGRLVVTGHIDGSIKFWQQHEEDLLLLCWLTLPTLAGHVTSLPFGEGRPVAHIRFSQRHQRLVVAHASGQVLVYSFSKTARPVTVAFHDVPLLRRGRASAVPAAAAGGEGDAAAGPAAAQPATHAPIRITRKMVNKLVSYGFNEADVRQALEKADGNLNVAAASLFEKSLLELDGGTQTDGAPVVQEEAGAELQQAGADAPDTQGTADADAAEAAASAPSSPTGTAAAAAPDAAGDDKHAFSPGTDAAATAVAGATAAGAAATFEAPAAATPNPSPEKARHAEQAEPDKKSPSETTPEPLSYEALPGLQLTTVLRCVCLDALGTTCV